MTALVLVHAFPLSARMWEDVRPGLAGLPEVSELFTPDLPGFGGRPVLPSPPSLDAYADDLAAQLDERGLRRVVLGGLSLGGYVVMAFLRRHGHRVNAVVLADTKAGVDAQAAKENRERIARTVLAERSPRVLVDDVLPGLLGATTTSSRPQVVSRVRSLVEAADPGGVAWAQRAMAQRPDSTASLRDVEVPALVVVGDEDALSPPAEAESMVAALPDARLVVVPQAGHLSAVEAPEAFLGAVGAFLADI